MDFSPLTSPFFWSLFLTSAGGIVLGSFVAAFWQSPRWLME